MFIHLWTTLNNAPMKIDEKILFNAFLALALWTIADRLFLGDMIDGILPKKSNFERSI